MDVYAWLDVRDDNERWGTVQMFAEEPEPEWTTGEAFDSRKLWDGDDFGAREIVSVDSDTFTYDRYTDTDHARDVLGQPRGELVDRFVCVGDTAGDEAGTRTRVEVYFDPIELSVRY